MSIIDTSDRPQQWTGRWRWSPRTAAQIDRFSIEHTAAGLRALARRLLAAHLIEVGIERPDGRWSTCCWPVD